MIGTSEETGQRPRTTTETTTRRVRHPKRTAPGPEGEEARTAMDATLAHTHQLIVDEVIQELTSRWGLQEEHLRRLIADAINAQRKSNERLDEDLVAMRRTNETIEARFREINKRQNATDMEIQQLWATVWVLGPVIRAGKRWRRRLLRAVHTHLTGGTSGSGRRIIDPGAPATRSSGAPHPGDDQVAVDEWDQWDEIEVLDEG